MKILIPQTTSFDFISSDSRENVVLGGIEKFCKDIEDTIDGVIPVFITKEDKEKKNTKKKIFAAIMEHEPDMILFNNPWWGNMMLTFNLPLICVVHEPLDRDIRMVALGGILKNLTENDAHLYFVSPNQLQYHRDMAMRISGTDFGEVKGFINSSFVDSDLQVSKEKIYDCATVGRTDILKNPFLLHKKLKNSDLNSLVITNDAAYKSEAQNAYVAANQHWKEPRHTIRGLPHDQVLSTLAKAKVFCSTCPKESWGITAMEALGLGIPLILVTDKESHSSEIVAADPSHYVKVNKNCTEHEFEQAVRSLMDIPYEKRIEISEMTKQKHSRENWKKELDKIIELRYNDKNINDLTEFFV